MSPLARTKRERSDLRNPWSFITIVCLPTSCRKARWAWGLRTVDLAADPSKTALIARRREF
jgi:hypothetical protein